MENIVTEAPVTITNGAYKELKKIIEEKDIPAGYGLRIGVKGGGCAGLSYILGFDQLKESDQTFQFGDITIYMEKSHGMYLAGMEVDFVDGLNNRGFTFNNPNASKSCGCGTSFSA